MNTTNASGKKIFGVEKITNLKWLNIFKVLVRNSKEHYFEWFFVSRKNDPINDTRIDAVVIVPIVNTIEGKKIVITKEWRWPLNDFEYGFPAGLIENGSSIEETVEKELKEETGLRLRNIKSISNRVYSSAGLSDEVCVIALVEADGEINQDHQENSEEIETLVMDVDEITKLIQDPEKKLGAKAWGILYHYSVAGKID